MPATPVSIATRAGNGASLARGPTTTTGIRPAAPSARRPSAAAAPTTRMAPAPPAAAQREAAARRERSAGSPYRYVTAMGYPVCQVSTASAPERLPPARSELSAARVGPLSACASAMSPSAR